MKMTQPCLTGDMYSHEQSSLPLTQLRIMQLDITETQHNQYIKKGYRFKVIFGTISVIF